MLSFRGFQAAGFLLSPAFFSLLLFLKASVVNGYVHGGFEAGGLDGKGRQVPWGGGKSYPRFMCWYFMHLLFACLPGELISYTFKS